MLYYAHVCVHNTAYSASGGKQMNVAAVGTKQARGVIASMSITGDGVDCGEDGSPCGLSDDTEIEFGTSEEGIMLIQ